MAQVADQPIDVAVDLPFDLLQTLRLVHAVTEAGFTLCVEPGDERKVIMLEKTFGLDYKVGTQGAARVSGLYVDHMTPLTRVGSIERPLIMPHQVFAWCRGRWPEARRIDASFAGILTETRRAALNGWLRLSGLEELSVPERPPLLRRALRKILRKLSIPLTDYVGTDNVKIFLSEQGRLFPRKAWNAEYYDLLLQSKFVLCPSGDFKHNGVAWTYRFFEGVICGAIPVVEESCAAYEGFKVRFMDAPVGALEWSEADAEHNFALARERLTVERDAMRSEVLGLLRAAGAPRESALNDYRRGVYAS